MKTPEKVVNHIVEWLKDYLKNSKMNGFVVGVSGGIDSAVTSTLCSLTNAPVLCLEMEIHQDPSQVSTLTGWKGSLTMSPTTTSP
jgi:NAD+ synthase